MRFIVTAGPTREHLDDVRFLTNASSGRMGYAIARAAAQRGHNVDLVTGPVSLPVPPGVRVHRVDQHAGDVRGGEETFSARGLPHRRGGAGRLHARPSDQGKSEESRIVPRAATEADDGHPRHARPREEQQVIIAFALEVQDPLKNARLKLRRKNADAIVLNSPAAIGARRSDATILLRTGARLEVRQATKQRLGRILVALAESLRATARDDGR